MRLRQIKDFTTRPERQYGSLTPAECSLNSDLVTRCMMPLLEIYRHAVMKLLRAWHPMEASMTTIRNALKLVATTACACNCNASCIDTTFHRNTPFLFSFAP